MGKKKFIYIMAYHSSLKRNGMLMYEGLWMNLENMLSKQSHTQNHMISFILARDERENWEVQDFFFSDGNVLELMVVTVQPYKCTKNH